MTPAKRRIEQANKVAADLYGPVTQHVPLPTRDLVDLVAEAFDVAVVEVADHRVGCAVLASGRAVTFDAPAQSKSDVFLPVGLEEYREKADR